MTKYISLLRGINVSGQKKIKMDDLRALYESLNFQKVTTYIQSGNVVFQSADSQADEIGDQIAQRIQSVYGFQVSIIIRTHQEIDELFKNNPFLYNRQEDISKLYVTFLAGLPPAPAVESIDTAGTNSEELLFSGREIYMFCPNGYGKTKLSNNFFEKKLGITATTRNWKTVQKLHGLSL